jgi:HEAT repeat protein
VHGPRCIEVAVELLDDPDSRVRLAALVALLDRGFGRPAQAIAADLATSAVGLHLVAAQLVSAQILERKSEPQPQTIRHEPRLLDSPVPTE